MAGVAIPLGSHRSAFNSAPIVGGELALRFTQTIDAVGLFSWQPSQSKYAVDTRRADVWVYNIGVERAFRGAQPTAGGVLVPFAGAGVGGRAYDFRSSVAHQRCVLRAVREWRCGVRAQAFDRPARGSRQRSLLQDAGRAIRPGDAQRDQPPAVVRRPILDQAMQRPRGVTPRGVRARMMRPRWRYRGCSRSRPTCNRP